jgi:large repetitive protein
MTLKRCTARHGTRTDRTLLTGAVLRVTFVASALVALGLTAAAPASASPMWNETTAPAVGTTDCITGTSEPLSTSSVGWLGDPSAPPQLNTVFYARVRWFVTAKPCIGAAPFTACRAPLTFTGLATGTHTFRARAVDLAGNVDPTPATRTWTIT